MEESQGANTLKEGWVSWWGGSSVGCECEGG
jgi:hypothetical protein